MRLETTAQVADSDPPRRAGSATKGASSRPHPTEMVPHGTDAVGLCSACVGQAVPDESVRVNPVSPAKRRGEANRHLDDLEACLERQRCQAQPDLRRSAIRTSSGHCIEGWFLRPFVAEPARRGGSLRRWGPTHAKSG